MDEQAFWVVWNPSHGNPTHRHSDRRLAIAEAERLARAHQDQSFYVLLALSVSKATNVHTKPLVQTYGEDSIPF